MSLWKIAWRSIQHRGLASLLTGASMALGVMLVVSVLTIYGVVSESFRNNASLGYNLILGAKGGKLQLTLNTVYYLSEPIQNVPYDFYLEFLPAEERDRELRQSVQHHGHEALWGALQAQALAAQAAGPGGALLGSMLGTGVLEDTTARHIGFVAVDTRPLVSLERGRPGRYAQFTEFVIPLALGDYYQQFRVVGTTPQMLDRVYDLERNRTFAFAEGRNFATYSEENGYFEAVAGWRVAQETGLKLGDEIAPAHGDPEGHGHDQTFRVVGILAPSGTPNDRAVFVNLEGFYLMDGHTLPLERGEPAEGEPRARVEPRSFAAEHAQMALPVEQREVTSMLLRARHTLLAMGLENAINRGPIAQAVAPTREIFVLLDMIVRPVQLALLTLTAMICVVSGVSILVSIYNSMSERRHEIAVMRALGASRGTVSTVVLMEAILLALGGGLVGWLAGHGLNWLASPVVEDQTGVVLGFWTFAPPVNVLALLGQEPTIEWLRVSSELLLIPALVLLAVIVGFLPAMAAYRTDVADSLGK